MRMSIVGMERSNIYFMMLQRDEICPMSKI